MGTIKIIKGVGPRLSTERLEAVSTQLLLARIRGSDPQVSFTFVQRLLDELIQRRREEELGQLEMDIILSDLNDDLPKEMVSIAAKLTPLNVESIDGLNLSASEYQEIPESEETNLEYVDDLEFPELTSEEILGITEILKVEELVLEHPAVPELPKIIEVKPLKPKPKRKPFVLRRDPPSIWKEFSFWRVFVITVVVIFFMICGVIAF